MCPKLFAKPLPGSLALIVVLSMVGNVNANDYPSDAIQANNRNLAVPVERVDQLEKRVEQLEKAADNGR